MSGTVQNDIYPQKGYYEPGYHPGFYQPANGYGYMGYGDTPGTMDYRQYPMQGPMDYQAPYNTCMQYPTDHMPPNMTPAHLMKGQGSSEVYPWMRESRTNNKRQNPGNTSGSGKNYPSIIV